MASPKAGPGPVDRPGRGELNEIGPDPAAQLRRVWAAIADLSRPRAVALQMLDALIEEWESRRPGVSVTAAGEGGPSQAQPDRTRPSATDSLVYSLDGGLDGRELVGRACLLLARVIVDPAARRFLRAHAEVLSAAAISGRPAAPLKATATAQDQLDGALLSDQSNVDSNRPGSA